MPNNAALLSGSSALPGWRLHGLLPAGVGACMSGRAGGVSQGPYASLNLGTAVGDEPAHVAENRRRFAESLGGAQPVWLLQVHGTRVLLLQQPPAADAALEAADAAVTSRPGLACTVQVADCLPVLLFAANGRAVGAAHAGWRGLAGGVLEATARAVATQAACAVAEVGAWLGPCIGPRHFEVGADVLQAFGRLPPMPGPMFLSRLAPDGSARWLADLQGLAEQRLLTLGLKTVHRDRSCTVEDAAACFSFRRDKVTGRMAAAIWLAPDAAM